MSDELEDCEAISKGYRRIYHDYYFAGEEQSPPPRRRSGPRNDHYHYTREKSINRGERRSATPRPSTSRKDDLVGDEEILSPEEKAQKMIMEAEMAKAKILSTPGENCNVKGANRESFPGTPATFVDENYIVVSAHIDESMMAKIMKGDYVDFGKLLPRDKLMDEEGRMEMYVRNGKTFWMPINTGVNITSFTKWEQAFCVFSNIYTKANPQRAAELIEYNHIIHMIAQTYLWENVYGYDKDFRRHMARHPERSWSIILQQAWALRLRDKIAAQSFNSYVNNSNGNTTPQGRPKVSEPCRRFNKGRCNFGTNCRYEHHCSYCFKYGHTNLTCRKAHADRENKFTKQNDKDRFNRGGFRSEGDGDRSREQDFGHSFGKDQEDSKKFKKKKKKKIIFCLCLRTFSIYSIFASNQAAQELSAGCNEETLGMFEGNFNLDEIVTPINIEVYHDLLQRYGYNKEKTKQLIQGFRYGFDIGYRGLVARKNVADNIPISVGSEEEMWNKVMKEVRCGRYAGPFKEIPYTEAYMQSPIGLVPKAGGQTRLIFHLSYNFGKESQEDLKSLNYHTPDEFCKVKYRDMDYAVKTCLKTLERRRSSRAGKESGEEPITLFFAKSDLRSAFRILPILPSQRCYLLMKARHPQTKEYMFFVEKNLPFGASVSCAKFQLFSDSLQFLVEKMAGSSFSVTNYLDDYLFIHYSAEGCNYLVRQFLELCSLINCPVAMDKTEWATPRIVFLGILMDGRKHMLVVPEEKKIKALHWLKWVRDHSKITIKMVQKLTGTLNFLGKAIVPGRTFTRSLYSKLKIKDSQGNPLKQYHHVAMGAEFKSDCQMWEFFLLN